MAFIVDIQYNKFVYVFFVYYTKNMQIKYRLQYVIPNT